MLDSIFKSGDLIRLKNGKVVRLDFIKNNIFTAINGYTFTYNDIYLGELEFLRKHLDILSLIRSHLKYVDSFMELCYFPYAGFVWKDTKEGYRFWQSILEFHKIPSNRDLTIFLYVKTNILNWRLSTFT